jgi:hypothetical protein
MVGMPWRPPFHLALLPLLSLAACATNAPAGDAGVQTLAARMPRTLLNFGLIDAKPVDGSPDAWATRYIHAASGSAAMVFLRPSRLPPLPDGPASPEVRAEIGASALAIQAIVKNGAPITRVPDYGAGEAGVAGGPIVRCADVRVQIAPNQVQRSLACASGVGGTMVTILLLAEHDDKATGSARVFLTSFAVKLVQSLREGAIPPVEPEVPAGPSGPIFRL